jgi:hypothetical protein
MVRFRDENGRALMSPADAGHGFYHDCDDTTAAWAIARLRPQSALPLTEPWPLTAWPDVARSVILARDDHAVRFDAGMEAGRLILDGADPIGDGRRPSRLCHGSVEPQWFRTTGPDTVEQIARTYMHFALAILRADANQQTRPANRNAVEGRA